MESPRIVAICSAVLNTTLPSYPASRAAEDNRLGSCNQFGGLLATEQYPQELVGYLLEVIRPLENDDILFQVCLIHSPERPEEVAQARPDPLQGIAMYLAHPIAVVVPRKLPPIVVDRRVAPALATQRVVPVPVVGIHHRARLRGRQDRGVNQLGRRAPATHPEPHTPALAAGHAGDRRPVGLPRAVPLGLVRSTSRRVVRVGV